jgi:membrane protease YdiL (CAAX protease family)
MIARGHSLSSLPLPAAILLGCVALAIRPPALWSASFVVIAVGTIGALAPLPAHRDVYRGPGRVWATVALGVLTFATARAITTPLPVPVTALTVGATIVAAVAEEIFFRRFVYGWLASAGTAVAIIGAAVLFAAVHVPAYGARVFPLDLAAGIIFGWQRWAAGGWVAPALTHAAANMLQLF